MNNTPDFLPTLSAGAHTAGSGEACVMEYVSILAGEKFSDDPACTAPYLAGLARFVNDALRDKDRHLLVPHIGRLFGTNIGFRDARTARQVYAQAIKRIMDVAYETRISDFVYGPYSRALNDLERAVHAVLSVDPRADWYVERTVTNFYTISTLRLNKPRVVPYGKAGCTEVTYNAGFDRMMSETFEAITNPLRSDFARTWINSSTGPTVAMPRGPWALLGVFCHQLSAKHLIDILDGVLTDFEKATSHVPREITKADYKLMHDAVAPN